MCCVYVHCGKLTHKFPVSAPAGREKGLTDPQSFSYSRLSSASLNSSIILSLARGSPTNKGGPPYPEGNCGN